jgi:hypothetical protein
MRCVARQSGSFAAHLGRRALELGGVAPFLVAGLLCLSVVPPARAADGRLGGARVPPGARSVAAVAAGGATAVKLDGDLNDGAWAKAPVIADFVQREPNEGKAPTLRTEARVIFDNTALFVAIRAFDPDAGKITGILTRRDTDSPSDWVGIVVDSYHDRRTAYEFDVNAAGVQVDKYRYNDTSQDVSWDAVWDVHVTRDDQGWTAKFRVPFSQLRFDPNRANTFGFAVVRRVGRLNETSTWPLLPRSAPGYVSSLGELTGLDLRGGRKRLEVVPYVVGQVETQQAQAGNPFVRASDAAASFGADAKFALTPGLTLTGTLNPDFGQVEADPAVVNLSAFETYFDERRPFFVEGSGIFRFDIDCNDGQCRGLFYSRRIGRTPRGSPVVPDGGFSSIPPQTTIIGAAKLTGRVGKFSVGALNAVTTDEQARVFDGASTSKMLVEPLTSYSVGRATREFANQSAVGFMVTATNRRLEDDVSFLPGDAYTGGADWDWRLGKKGAYSLTGNVAASTVRGSAEAIATLQTSMVHAYQRPDAGHVSLDTSRTTLNGMNGQAGFARIAGDRVRFNSNAWFKTPGFDINDLGFLTRADERGVSNWLQVRNDKPSKHFRNTRLNFNQWGVYNFDGDRLALGGNINGNVRTQGNHGLGGGINVQAEAFDDRLTRGGPGGRTTRWLYGWHFFESDDRKRVQYTHFVEGGRDWHGSSRLSFGPSIRVRPSAALSVSVGMDLSRNIDDSQWVENLAGAPASASVTGAAPGSSLAMHYVFGHLDQTTVATTFRVNYTLTPRLSIQLYGAPFVSAGAYTGFKELVDGRAAAYEDRYSPYAYPGNPDFNYKSFRTTNVLRWEYRPGSTLFIVWQQGREEVTDSGRFRFGRDFEDVFRAAGHNVFLVKMAHWLNL